MQIIASDEYYDYYLLNADTITEEALDLLIAEYPSMRTVMTFLTLMMKMTFQMMMMYKLFSSV